MTLVFDLIGFVGMNLFNIATMPEGNSAPATVLAGSTAYILVYWYFHRRAR